MSFPFQARFLILHQSSELLNSLATDLDSGHSEDEAVSEYQYYEFVAIDGPISDEGLRYARGCSSRAEVSRVRWKNEYQFGNFHGKEETLLEHYDAHFYIANWGTVRLGLAFPEGSLSLEAVQPYLRGGERYEDTLTLQEIGKRCIVSESCRSLRSSGLSTAGTPGCPRAGRGKPEIPAEADRISRALRASHGDVAPNREVVVYGAEIEMVALGRARKPILDAGASRIGRR
jgi:hypothetical protein